MARYRIQVVKIIRPSTTPIRFGRSDWRVVAGVGYRDSAVSLCASATYVEPLSGIAPGCRSDTDVSPGTAYIGQRQEATRGKDCTQPPEPAVIQGMSHSR